MSERNPDSGQPIRLSGVELGHAVHAWTSLSHSMHGPLELHDGFVLWRQHGNLPVIIPLSNVRHAYPLTMDELPRPRGGTYGS